MADVIEMIDAVTGEINDQQQIAPLSVGKRNHCCDSAASPRAARVASSKAIGTTAAACSNFIYDVSFVSKK